MKTKVLTIGAAWLALAIFAGASGAISKLHPPLPQLVLFGLSGALVFAFWRASDFRSWLLTLPPRFFVLLNVTRFIGFYFLVLRSHRQLPSAFAVPAGCGDIAVAGFAVIIACMPADSAGGRRAYLAWNIMGLADILFVVFMAARLAVLQPDSMRALTHLPLSLLPTFLVPIIIASHIVLFVKLRTSKSYEPGSIQSAIS
jgi:hypothetical protein